MLTRAALVNAWRKLFPHPAAIARREESRRAKASRERRDRLARQRALLVGRGMLNAKDAMR